MNKNTYFYIFEPTDWLTIIVLCIFIIYGVTHDRDYIFRTSWIDKVLFIYLFLLFSYPLLFNFRENIINHPMLKGFFFPIKIWVVYRLFFYIFSEYSIKDDTKSPELHHYIFNTFLYAATVSAVISILRYFPIPFVQDFIEETWPIISNGVHLKITEWKQLWATMSGTNGSGNFFAFSLIISLYQLKFYKRKRNIIFSLLFLLCVILSGSLGSFITMLVGVFLLYYKSFSAKHLLSLFLIFLFIFVLFGFVDSFRSYTMRRARSQLHKSKRVGILPYSLAARLGYWQDHLKYVVKDDKYLFGFGVSGIRDYYREHNIKGHGNPESFYFTLILQSGFVSLLMYFVMMYIIFSKTNILRKSKLFIFEFYLIRILLIMYLFAQVTNNTLNSGGSLELFSLLLILIYYARLGMRRQIAPIPTRVKNKQIALQTSY